jgi:hypothetical protein
MSIGQALLPKPSQLDKSLTSPAMPITMKSRGITMGKLDMVRISGWILLLGASMTMLAKKDIFSFSTSHDFRQIFGFSNFRIFEF